MAQRQRLGMNKARGIKVGLAEAEAEASVVGVGEGEMEVDTIEAMVNGVKSRGVSRSALLCLCVDGFADVRLDRERTC